MLPAWTAIAPAPALRLAVPFEQLEFQTLSPIHGVTSLPVTWRPSYCDPDNRLTN